MLKKEAMIQRTKSNSLLLESIRGKGIPLHSVPSSPRILLLLPHVRKLYTGELSRQNYFNWIKGAKVLDCEAEMTSQGRLLDFSQHHKILQNFYKSDKALRSRQRRLKFMTRYFSSVLERMLTAAGETVLNELTSMRKKTRHLFLLLKSMLHLILADGKKAGRPSI